MGFKNYLNEEIQTKTPKPYKTKVQVSLKEYKDLINNSKLKKDRKALIANLVEMSGSIPVFCAESQKFFMVDLQNSSKARDVKTREEKAQCGVLLNAMLAKMNESGNEGAVKALTEMNFGWDIPELVYKTI